MLMKNLINQINSWKIKFKNWLRHDNTGIKNDYYLKDDFILLPSDYLKLIKGVN